LTFVIWLALWIDDGDARPAVQQKPPKKFPGKGMKAIGPVWGRPSDAELQLRHSGFWAQYLPADKSKRLKSSSNPTSFQSLLKYFGRKVINPVNPITHLEMENGANYQTRRPKNIMPSVKSTQ